MPLTTEKKKNIIDDYKLSDQDTGSAQVQVALLSEKINALMNHFDEHKKDHHSRQGLLKMVNQRRKLLRYLREKNQSQYQSLISKLGLRK
ncbi:MAG TPA: 30S ribosomal protein S15 [Gammaproteobacteria bacterium]|jgi:small subunit ribosomal protein S15|nr:30S ribosomal protein S15 [Gammaproteobacteria bacterium]|tara:strand:+ start:344 stop:613 length:270 start_codon:yes stop_codon:yes gene_type:complete